MNQREKRIDLLMMFTCDCALGGFRLYVRAESEEDRRCKEEVSSDGVSSSNRHTFDRSTNVGES